MDLDRRRPLLSNLTHPEYPITPEAAQRFHESRFKAGLLVLDGVNSEEIIEALNIGCKTLVTTHDENVMNKQGNRYKAIKVNEGFTEEESLFHLASCVGLSVENLPSQAKLIHLNGKGHPLVMSLIGAHLEDQQEEARNNQKPWKSCLDVLINKDYGQAFQELKILTVVNLYILEAVTYVHLKSPDEVMTGAQQHDYNTQHAANYHLPAHRLASMEKKPTYVGAKLWNALPLELKKRPTAVWTQTKTLASRPSILHNK
ncbi:hypothetical protein J6590_006767 [Homalodisca vitripennis]|nr:hypothetical protein J6590_006767 [Homalodisca vitripennis]